MRRLLPIVTFLCLVPAAFAGTGMAQLRIVHPNGMLDLGSAVCVGPCELGWRFVTAKHNLQGFNPDRDKAALKIDGDWVPIVAGSRHRQYDVATVIVRYDRRDLKYALIAERLPGDGERVHAIGYPNGTPVAQKKHGRWRRGQPWLDNNVFIPGDSGGGVFNEEDELLMTITGIRNSPEGVGTTCDRIRGWFRRRGWRLPSQRPRQQGTTPIDGPVPNAPPQITEPSQPDDDGELWEAIDDIRSEIAEIKNQPDDSQALRDIRVEISNIKNDISSITQPSGDYVTVQEFRDALSALKSDLQGLRGPPGPRGKRGPAGDCGPMGERGPGFVRLWLDGDELWTETTDGKIIQVGRVELEYEIDLEQLAKAVARKLPKAEQGPRGRVDVVITDSGRPVGRHDSLESGSTVVVDINRFLKSGASREGEK